MFPVGRVDFALDVTSASPFCGLDIVLQLNYADLDVNSGDLVPLCICAENLAMQYVCDSELSRSLGFVFPVCRVDLALDVTSATQF